MSRTVPFGFNSVTYPDQRVYAFSPYKVEVTGTSINQLVTFTYNGYTITRYTNASNKVIIEISGLLQSFFAGLEFGVVETSSNLILTNKNINVAIGTDNQDLNFDIIFGALQFGEIEATEDTIYRFGTLPLTLTQTIGEDMEINGSLTTSTYGSNNNISNVTTTPILFKTDSTINKTINVVNLTACSNSYYLRWIDRYGNYRYYSFLFGKKTEQTKLGTAYNYNVMSLDATGGLIKQSAQLIGKDFGEVIIVSEPSADALKTAHIRSIFTSPKVWLYVGVNWMEVTVAENELTENYNEGAREINVSIIMPKKYNQEL